MGCLLALFTSIATLSNLNPSFRGVKASKGLHAFFVLSMVRALTFKAYILAHWVEQ